MFHKSLKKVLITFFQISPKYKIIHYGGREYDFDDWNKGALIDGWVCRNDADCTWIDERLGCNDYGFESNQIKVNDRTDICHQAFNHSSIMA